MNPGWIYILTNASLQSNYLKIGYTTDEPSSRAADLSAATGVAAPFHVAYSEVVPDCIRAEVLVHQKLAGHRVANNREFFQIDLTTAKKIVHETCASVRIDSPFCRQCDATAAVTELSRLRHELDKHKTRLKRLRRRMSILAFFRNFISLIISTVNAPYQKAVPHSADRHIYTRWLLLPLAVIGWIVLLFLFRPAALALLLTLLFLAALVVLGSAAKED